MSGIAAWLDGLGLGNYATIFVENAIDLDVLPDLNETDLKRLGVALGHRKRILRAIADLSRHFQRVRLSQTLRRQSPKQSDAILRHCFAIS